MLEAGTSHQIEATVVGKIRAILAERGAAAAAPLAGDSKLSAHLGLTSLDLAFLVSQLEFEFGVDPFAKLVAITDVRTIDDLVDAYRQALVPNSHKKPDGSLADAQKRAEKRRLRIDQR